MPTISVHRTLAEDAGRPQLLVVSLHAPEATPLHAGGEFLRRHLADLATDFDVTVAALPPVGRNLQGPPPPGQRVVALGPTSLPSRLLASVDAVVKVAFGFFPGVRSFWWPPARRKLKRLAEDADLVEIEWLEAAVFLPLLRRAGNRRPVACVCHDIVSQSWERKATSSGSPIRRLAYQVACRRARRQQRVLLALCDEVVVFSEKDRTLLQRDGLTTPVRVVDPPFDVPAEPAANTGSECPVVLFTGAMSRRENYQAAEQFIVECWPRIRAAHPTARFLVAGADPPERLHQRDGLCGVTVTGEVADLSVYYRQAAVFVAPLRLGAGLKFKVVDALMHGLPVVASPVAVEGIADTCGVDTFAAITTDWRDMADAVVALLDNADLRSEVGARARERATARFGNRQPLEALRRRYVELVARSPSRRRGAP